MGVCLCVYLYMELGDEDEREDEKIDEIKYN